MSGSSVLSFRFPSASCRSLPRSRFACADCSLKPDADLPPRIIIPADTLGLQIARRLKVGETATYLRILSSVAAGKSPGLEEDAKRRDGNRRLRPDPRDVASSFRCVG
jgi:hypothetical protein